ncbi:MAG: COX aromatic rich motif-containing protein [Gammaproteobacteria bacterium]|nr:COX aromatic rich motif-containing protein [Gammaproteobacteria bacterium]
MLITYLSTLIKFLLRCLLPLICLLILCLTGCADQSIGLLNPKGLIAFEERKLFFDTLALMLIVVLPVIIMSFTFVYHYRASHRIKEYKPNWGHNLFLESLWWGIPCIIIFVLAILTWKKTYELDPYQRISHYSLPVLQIHVIALPWKWLFIYPQENIATVNYLEIPIGQQVEYWITTDNVPMSAFFIPQLGSQIYAMAGMRTRLHLLANHLGVYDGMNTQFNGDGFSDMHFPVHVVEPEEMQQWVNKIKKSPHHLTEKTYLDLLKPSINNPPQFFSGAPANLFNQVIALYMYTVGTAHPRSREANYADWLQANHSHKE